MNQSKSPLPAHLQFAASTLTSAKGFEMKPSTHPTEDEIRDRARELWERHHRPEGYEMEFWLQAERELKGDDRGIGASVNAPSAKSGGGSDGPG